MKFDPPRQMTAMRQTDKGFALVVTLTLMILLTMVAVGLLELVGKGSLGASAAAKVTAGLVPVATNGKVQGNYACMCPMNR